MQRDGGGDGTSPLVRVVIASDGKRGHENQSRVLARILGDTEPLVMRLRNPEGGWGETLMRAAFAVRGRWRMPKRSAGERVRELMRPESPAAFRDFSTEIGRHRADYRIFTVSTGTPPATGNLLLASLLDAEPLCVMTPSMLPRRLFKLMIVPSHDVNARGTPDNVLLTPLALGYHDLAAAQLLAHSLESEIGGRDSDRYLGIGIGNTGGTSDDIYEELADFRDIAFKHNYKILMTTSRRSHRDYIALIPEVISNDHPDLMAHVVDASKTTLNPLPAFYEICDRMLVTNDSFSMISEAIHAGHQVVVDRLPKHPRRKIERSICRLAELGLVVPMFSGPREQNFVGIPQPAPVDWAGTPGRKFEPNRYYTELRAQVRARLSLD